MEKLQASLGISVPAATQWDIVQGAAQLMEPAYEALKDPAAQGEVLHNDDTPMKILALMAEGRPREGPAERSPERTGVFTSGVLSKHQDHRIALFFTGREHAGENLQSVLEKRSAQLMAPIQNGLSRHLPAELEVILANCLSEGRRRFVEVVQKRVPQERLRFHQQQSGALMQEFHAWLESQLAEQHLEPNSGLGDAISYLLKRWEKLTLFLREPGAPLDNNLCERALKKTILHRKNSLFYMTKNGARVGDIFMSLIHTAELSGTDPFDYLRELQTHAVRLQEAPTQGRP